VNSFYSLLPVVQHCAKAFRLKSHGAEIFSGTECAEPITAIEKAPQKKRNGCDWSRWLRTFRSAEYFRPMGRRPYTRDPWACSF